MQNHLKLPKGRICCSLIEQANGKAADTAKQSIMPIYTKSAIKRPSENTHCRSRYFQTA